MTSPFKIQRKKQPAGSDSAHPQSPLSRLYGPAPRQQGAEPASASASHRGTSGQSQEAGRRAEPAAGLNGWRPKRASERLLGPGAASERLSPLQKKSRVQLSGLTLVPRSVSVKSPDALAEQRGERRAGSRSSPTPGARTRRTESDGDAAEGKSDGGKPPKQRNSSPSGSDPSRTGVRGPFSPARRRLDRTAWLGDPGNPQEDAGERERRRWREFRERKSVPRPRLQAPAEPIVLSSEDDEEPNSRTEKNRPGRTQDPATGNRPRSPGAPPPPPTFLQLEFSSLHAGLTHAAAGGEVLITEDGITIPLTGGEVTVVASQLRGYGVWDGGVARGGSLLAGREGPAPSLLFLWVTGAQANLLQRELAAIQSSAPSGPPCSFLLLVLKEQLQELQAALLASILDMEEYRKGRSSSSSSSSSPRGPPSPLDWTDGLLLLHGCPPPLDRHLLALLGRSAELAQVGSGAASRRSGLSSSGPQQLPVRLIQYPATPGKGRITVTKEDLACLDAGNYLNDVIIDFYLKYLLLEGVGGPVAERSHVFSSFFYRQLSRRRAAGEDDAPSVPDRHTRHQRVKTWTRHVDIFSKDFLFVPVNKAGHWFLVVVCFPGLEEVQYKEFHRGPGESERAAGKPTFSPRTQPAPDCTQLGHHRDTVLQRPCILVMDSLRLSDHDDVCRLLRDYLQVEWDVRRGTPRLFTRDTVRSGGCVVPEQDNSSDCGLYLLQYVESFLQNPVVHFDLPLRLGLWFPRRRVRQKREEIRSLIVAMHQNQRR